MHTRTWLSLAGLTLATGCVSAGKYDSALADAERTRAELRAQRTSAERNLARDRAQLTELRRTMAETERRCDSSARELDQLRASSLGCAKALDDAIAVNLGLKKELERLGQNVDDLLSTRSQLASSLEQTRARLQELRNAQQAADSRAAMLRDVALRLKRMIDAGQLSIKLRSGRMVIVMPEDVLFDSGKTEVKPAGRDVLAQVGGVLASLEGKRFQVAGHTDNQPIRFSGFASNWELSSERGLAVVQYLIKSGMRPDALSAAGYGEYDPVMPNDTPENRAKNRRIEITAQPNIDELVDVPEAR